MPKVSIIVPVYGVEKYIERCAKSLLNQTFIDIEFIFVDDCTKDHSIDVLLHVMEEYPARKENVRIIHHNINKGLPQARRTGMLAAKGDYIINFDSDDWVDSTIIEAMYNRAIADESDIVICDMCLTDGRSRHVVKGCYSLEKKELLKDLCTHLYIWSTCNKLIRRSLINEDVVFPKCNNGEDMAFTIPLVLKAERFSYVSGPMYYYYYNSDSITKVGGEEFTLCRYRMFLQNVEIVLSAFAKTGLSREYKDVIDVVKFGSKKILLGLVHDRKYFKMWKNTYSEINIRFLYNKYVSVEEKLKYILTYIHLYPRKESRIPLDNS